MKPSAARSFTGNSNGRLPNTTPTRSKISPVRKISEDKILSDNQRAMKHDLLMLVPPFQEQTMVKNLGSADESGFAEVNE